MKKEITMDELREMFLHDHRIVEMSLATSFSKYATRRDELIKTYSRLTTLPESHFENILTDEMAKVLCSTKSIIDVACELVE